MFFKRDDKYEAVETNALIASPTLTHATSIVEMEDEEEIVAFDRRIARRRAQAIMEEDDEDDGRLEDHRPHRVGHVGPVGPDQ
jgi:hypothetical protein